MYKLTPVEEKLCKEIVDCAYLVHKQLGPGLLEKIYEACFCHELNRKQIAFQRQDIVPIVYDSITFDEGLRIDVFVENLIICEFKAVNEVNPVYVSQVISYAKLVSVHIGFLINFKVALIKQGI